MQISWNAPWYYIGDERSLGTVLFALRLKKKAKRCFRKKIGTRNNANWRVLETFLINKSHFACSLKPLSFASSERVEDTTLTSIYYLRPHVGEPRKWRDNAKSSWKCQLVGFYFLLQACERFCRWIHQTALHSNEY